jgi:signal transduction histidine kinase
MRTIRELLYNSAKYSDGKHVSMHVTQTENTIRYIVEDVGSGLSEEQQEMIFMPFGKINDLSEGLGLGLPLAKRHAQGLGGDLTLDTTYQEGCRFILELPKE